MGVIRTSERLMEPQADAAALNAAPVTRAHAPRTLAFYLPALAGGGAERVVLDMCALMIARGHTAWLVLDRHIGELANQIPHGVKLAVLEAAKTTQAAPKLAVWLKANRPDVLISSLPYNNLTAVAAHALSGRKAKLVLWEHNMFTPHPLIRDKRFPILRLAARLMYGRSDRMIAVSNAVAEDLSTSTGVPRNRIDVIYNPIKPAALNTLPAAPPHTWLAARELPVVISAGRLMKIKDFATLVRAFAAMSSALPSRLIILGEGDERGSLLALADELGVADRVLLPGFVEQPWKWMAHARVFALSSIQEGFGNVIVEALSCGVPVVSTDSGAGPAEILGHGAFGEVCKVGNAPQLADALKKAITTPQDPARLIERAAQFAPAMVADQFDQFVARLFEKS